MQYLFQLPFEKNNSPVRLALLFALVVHIVVIFGISFSDPDFSNKRAHTMQVTLLTGRESKAIETDIAANIEQAGSGNSEEKEDNQQAIPGALQKAIPNPAANAAAKVAEALSAPQGSFQLIAPGTEESHRGESSKRLIDRVLPPLGLMSTTGDAAITKLFGPNNQAMRLHPAAKKGIAVEYKEAWRRWMSSNGNLHYPQEARRMRLRGEVLTEIALNANGSLANVRILQSSGQHLLDQAVLQTTREAKWFKPFPDELKEHANILVFSYRWRYGY